MTFSQELFLQGLQDYCRGMMLTENPYPVDTIDHASWKAGWIAEQNDRNKEIHLPVYES